MTDTRRLSYLLGLGILMLVGSVAFNAHADTGHEGAVRKEIGRYAETRLISGSSVAGTAFLPVSVKRPDSMCLNNTSSTVWLGTTTATQNNVLHENIRIGFPLFSSATFRVEGSFTGTLAFTCDSAVTACQMRCLDGLVP